MRMTQSTAIVRLVGLIANLRTENLALHRELDAQATLISSLNAQTLPDLSVEDLWESA